MTKIIDPATAYRQPERSASLGARIGCRSSRLSCWPRSDREVRGHHFGRIRATVGPRRADLLILGVPVAGREAGAEAEGHLVRGFDDGGNGRETPVVQVRECVPGRPIGTDPQQRTGRIDRQGVRAVHLCLAIYWCLRAT